VYYYKNDAKSFEVRKVKLALNESSFLSQRPTITHS